MTTPTGRVLLVCTGNVCRSPLAELLLRRTFADCPGVQFASAGTYALTEGAMPEPACDVAEGWGLDRFDAEAHQPRQLTAELVAEADVVLALTRDHRAEVVRLLPRANRYTFTLREVARLLESAAQTAAQTATQPPTAGPLPRTVPELVEAARAERGYAPLPDDPADDDVIDPYRQSTAVYDRSAAQIADAVRRIAAVLSAP